MELTTLSDFINWLAGPGLPYFVGVILSLLASKFPAWNNLPREIKIAVPVVLAVVSAFAFRALNVPEIVNNPDLNFAYNIIIFYLASQAQHERNTLRFG